MVASATTDRLTEAHRLAQARLGAQVVTAMRAVWPLLDSDDLDGTFERWLTAASMIIGGQRVVSSRLAANYLQTQKALQIGPAANSATIILAETVPADAVTTSMMVTGPGAVKSAIGRGVQPAKAMDVAEARSAASAMRHVLNGGRETTTQSLRADRDAQGWQRVTSSNACDFCSMLAGRGAVYSTDTVDFHAHDGCSCSAAPVYA